MDDLQRLDGIDAIRQVKARCFHGFDHKDRGLWRDEAWPPDGELFVPALRPGAITRLRGREGLLPGDRCTTAALSSTAMVTTAKPM